MKSVRVSTPFPARRLRAQALRRAAGALVFAAGALLPACSKPAANAEQGRSAAPATVPVRVAQVVAKDMPVQVRSIAWVEAYSTVTVKPQVAGQLLREHFLEGQDLEAGALLFSLDTRPFKAALDEAEGTLARDTALARDAVAEAQREEELYRQGVATQREYDSTRAKADSLQASVQAETAAVEFARLQLDYCSIRAPIAGRAGSIQTRAGNIVKANETTLVVINQIKPIYVTMAVPEQHLGAIKSRQAIAPLEISVRIGDEKQPEIGQLTFIDNQVDNTTGTILLKGTFPNEAGRLWPGQFVNAALRLATQAAAVVVPGEAIQTGQAGQFVFVMRDDMTVESRPVRVGLTVDNEVVIAEGLAPGEMVVTDGHSRLVPGAKVSLKSASPEPPAAPTTPAASEPAPPAASQAAQPQEPQP